MRITGGRARGIPLKSPPGKTTRPATDYLREAVFSSLGPSIQGAVVLDLFAGTGAYGLEALSRGAEHLTWVEQNRKAATTLQQNAEAVCKSLSYSKSQYIKNFQNDVFRWNSSRNEGYDIIFCDPPYELLNEKAEAILSLASECLKTVESSRFILEAPGGFELPTTHAFQIFRQLKKSKNQPSAFILAHKHEAQ